MLHGDRWKRGHLESNIPRHGAKCTSEGLEMHLVHLLQTRHEPRVRDACHVDEGQTQAHLGRLALRGALCGLNPPVLDAEFPPHQLLVVLGESVGESGVSPQQES